MHHQIKTHFKDHHINFKELFVKLGNWINNNYKESLVESQNENVVERR